MATENKCGHLTRIYYPIVKPLDQLNFRKENDRLCSFLGHRWSEQMKQTPEIMAKAGFYCEGNCDWVRCHFCDLRLWKWLPNDNPFWEHYKRQAVQRTKCPYVTAHKSMFTKGTNEKFCCDVGESNQTMDYFK